MSFTTDIKNEICMLTNNDIEILSELSGFIRNNHMLVDDKIQMLTENPKIARRIYSLIRDKYNVEVNIFHKEGYAFNKKRYYIIEVIDKNYDILKDLNILTNDNNLIKSVYDYMIETEEEKRAYLRGCFLACGSINDPKKAQYHLEMMIDIKEEAIKIKEILDCFYLPSKILERDNGYMLYMKEAEKIGDFLRLINAFNAVLYYEDIRIYRDHKNMTNRLNNCEQANIDKVISSCNKQLEDIKTILEVLEFDALDDKIKEAINYRRKYPESSLLELSQIISIETEKNITKSGLNHRFRKIKEMADKIKKG